MVADRLLVDLSVDGLVTVSTWPEGELPETVSSAPLAWSLDDDVLEDLRWYLEDYLRAPFGVWEDRGPQIQKRLGEWGEAVFSSVFGAGPARDAYMRAKAMQGPVELVFRSGSAALLGLPWELMRDPSGPVALNLAGVSRSLPVAARAQTVEVPGGRLRVLMVIARPAGTGDVGYRMIARPLLERLNAVRGEVDLVVLRPPTLDGLRQALVEAKAAGKPFHMVHFDGHGKLADRSSGAGRSWKARPGMLVDGGEGVLAFERPGGGADYVAAPVIAQVLKDAGVPVVVLNACQSGAVGKELEAAVATALLRSGMAAVVAMAYSVYAVAAAEFMAAFYEALFAGQTVSMAVTAGRRRLFQQDLRPSAKGEMPLADWLVPVHYLRRDVSFGQARAARPARAPSLDAMLDQLRQPVAALEGGAKSFDPVGEFVGRDGLFYELEAATRLHKVVVLHGPGGTGKTELAKAFGRWWRDTGGVDDPEWVVWHSFEPGIASFGLAAVVTQVGLAVFGADFARLDPGERRAVVERLLVERRLLLVWDNFESVKSMPDPRGATLPLGEAECAELGGFLAQLANNLDCRSAVILTSRNPEDWLGDRVRRIGVDGLAAGEAIEYASDLLATYPNAAPRRKRQAFGELLEWLDGHPLSMRVILPRLDTIDPEGLLDGLRGTIPLPSGDDPGEDRGTSLAASISYSFTHLGQGTRRLLPAVCLFHGVADAGVLVAFSQVLGCPARFAGARKDEWEAVLADAARVGLLTGLGARMWQVHPALPTYLADWWRAEDPENHDGVRDAGIRALVTAYARLGEWLSEQVATGNARLAYQLIDLQRRTLGAMLGYALDHQMWEQAEAIAQPLDEYWDTRGLVEEGNAWANRVQAATESPDGRPPSPDSPAESLWLFITSAQANRQLQAGLPGEAERSCRRILATLEAQPASPGTRAGIAVTYNLLGMIAQGLGRLDEAEDWHRKSLTIDEELGKRHGMAVSYHHLGVIAHQQNRLDEAEDWYRKTLAIEEELGNQTEIARSYHRLGIIAQDRGQPDKAEEWYLKALVLLEELGNRPGIAATYHQLGMIAQGLGQLDEAEDWYRKSLTIKEELGNRPGIAATYHQLGITAQRRGRLDDAENWYRKCLVILEELGDRPHVASSYGQLGLLAEQRGQSLQALEWMVRCVTLFDQFPHPSTAPGPDHLARLAAQLGVAALEQCWREVTGSPLPQAIRNYVSSDRPRHGQQEE